MTNKYTLLAIGIICIAAVAGFVAYFSNSSGIAEQNLDATPQKVTLSGTYVCLPHLDTTGPQTDECAFGLKADDGTYYAVNFGASANTMQQFRSGSHIQAAGFLVIKEALSSDHWAKYNMKGIFTVEQIIEAKPAE